ncbi:MAG: branched-chain amino acid aminotransferase [Hyphomicrobiaceae bacterium TMED74]|nr:branched chain amino acid aminotransferase [Filomicrobium sp.]RPG46231.1 MAG: branched-chain amino acid aminotransferase [Hyphomicrobiaceae bacterium TMED74]
MANQSETWTYLDGDWHNGNVLVAGPRTHAFWLGSSVFNGARAFEGVTPDLDRHCERLNQSARALGLAPTQSVETIMGLVEDGLKKFQSDDAIYVRPMYWADDGGMSGSSVPPNPETTRFLLCLYVAKMNPPKGFSITLSPFRRPTPETMPTSAKSGCLYPNNARCVVEAKSRGFDNALVLDMLGNVAEAGTSNLFMAKDGIVKTPVLNGTFLAGITRQRTIDLLRADGVTVEETTLSVADFMDADEIFSTGNNSKIVAVNRLEDREMQPGPMMFKARELYWDWAHSKS